MLYSLFSDTALALFKSLFAVRRILAIKNLYYRKLFNIN